MGRHSALGEHIMTEEPGMERLGDVVLSPTLSRRAMLRAVAATAVAATSVGRAVPAFAQTGAPAAPRVVPAETAFAQSDPGIAPFTYRAPDSDLDDLRQRLAHAR